MTAIQGTIRDGLERQHMRLSEADWLAERKKDITSTEVAALFGLSPYMSAFELWHAKANIAHTEFETTERILWGNRLQDAIAVGIAEDEGLTIEPLALHYSRVLPTRLGSSFDYLIAGSKRHGATRGLLEIKKVDEFIFKNQWCVDGVEEAPAHIEIQIQTQFECRDFDWGIIGVLIGGNRTRCLYRARDREMGALIRERVAAFWASIEAKTPPVPDLAKDAAFIARLYNFADPGKVYDGRADGELADLMLAYAAAGAAEKAAKEDKDRAKSAILLRIGDAERAVGNDGWSISAGMVAGGPVSFVREPFRSFRVNKSKVKT